MRVKTKQFTDTSSKDIQKFVLDFQKASELTDFSDYNLHMSMVDFKMDSLQIVNNHKIFQIGKFHYK